MKLQPEVQLVITTLIEAGYEAYAIGGCVRDYLIGKDPKDWDVCTSALPQDILTCFNSLKTIDKLNNIHVVETGVRYGTITVVVNKLPIEVTTFRTESDYEDNRKPTEVKFVNSLKEDLARRDFTMNALAFSLPNGQIIDYFGGKEDIKNNIIRAVGNPGERIEEDALRILRGLRFSSQLGFSIDKELSDTIHLKKHLLNNISYERLQNEFDKLIIGDDVLRVLRQYCDVLAEFMPEIKPMFNFPQDNPHHYLDCWEHTIKSVSVSSKELTVRLTMFFHDIGKPHTCTRWKGGTHFYGHADVGEGITRTIMNRLKYPNEIKSDVTTLVKYHDIQLTPKAMLRWMNKIGEKRVRMLLDVMAADIKAQSPLYYDELRAELDLLIEKYHQIIENNKCFKIKDLAINGRDILDMGYSQNEQIGIILKTLLNEVIEENVENTKDALMNMIEQKFSLPK